MLHPSEGGVRHARLRYCHLHHKGAVWRETVVSEGVLTNCIAELRQALGDDAKRPRFIATVHRRGYRFIAPLSPPAPAVRPAAPAPDRVSAPGPRPLAAPQPVIPHL